MEGNIYINGVIGSTPYESGVELIDVISQVKKQPNATSYNVFINSEGGIVEVGYDIYNYLKSLDVPVKTIGTGLVASIATVIFMAGSTRIIREGTRFMIHLPTGDLGGSGTADELEDFAKEVRDIEDKLVKFYSEITSTSKEAIKPLLQNETWLTQEQLNDLGFTNDETLMIAAKLYLNKNTNKMAELSNDDKSFIEKGFDKIFNLLKPKTIENIAIQDANGVTLDFPEVEDGQEITVGAKATVDGAAADGEYVMPTGETYVFSSGELTEIKEGEQEDEMQALKDENAALKEQLQGQKEATAQAETELETQKELVVNLTQEVREFKSTITSKFDLEEKETPKKDEVKHRKTRKLLKQE